MAAGTPVSFAASAFESSNTPASLSPGQHTDDDCTGGATPVASVGVGFSAGKSGSKWQKVRENLDLDGKPSPRGRRMLGRKPTATKKDWSVLKIAMNGMRLKNVQQSAESLALSQELNSLSPAREVMEEDLQAAETELQKTFRIAVRAAVELQGDLQHVQKRELAAKLESQLWERTKWVENIIDRTTSLKEREAEHKGATAALQEKVLAANQHISAALAATDESAREAEEESRRMLNEATAAADAAADEVEALRKRLNQVEGRVSSGEESLREKLAANAALEKELKDAAALHAFALADAREKHAAEAKELREKLSAAQMAFDTKLKAVESEREKEAAELRANLVAAEGDAAERISEAASTEGELQNLREKLEVSLAESVDASELREKLTAARDERERAVLDLEVEARKVDELRRELGDSIAAASLADDGLKAQLAAARAELLEKEGQITRNAEAHENEVAELQHKLVQAQSDGEAKVAVVAATKAEVEKRLAAAARDCDAIKLAGEARVLDLEKQLEDAAARSSEAIAAARRELAEALSASDESAREAEEESRRMLNEATAAADAAADEVEALRKRLNQVEGRVSSGEESLREKLAANAALEKELKDAAALHAFALADAREKHAAEAKELREKLSAAQMAFDTKLKAVESEREKEAAELRANLVAAEGDAAERISEAASTEGELQNLREKLEVSLAESVDASELREKLTAARDERERAVLDLEVEARKVDELRRELGDSIAAASLADDGLKAQLAAARAELLEKEGQITRNAEAHENEVAELQHKLVQAQSDGEAKVAVVAATKAEVEKRLAAAARDCDAIKLAGEARVLDLEKQLEDAAARSSEAIAASLSDAARLRADLEAANETVNSMHDVEFSASKGEKRFADLESRLDVQRPRAESSAEIFSVPEARLEASENGLSHKNAAVNEEVERLTAQLQRVRDVGEAEANENAKAQKAVVAATELSRGRDEELVTLRSCLQASENTVRQSTATLEEKLRETIELKTELALVSAALRSAERKVQELTESREGQTSMSANANYGATSHSPEGAVNSLLDTPNTADRDAAALEVLEVAKTSAAREHARLSKALCEASASLGTAHRELGEAREQALSACRRAEEAESAANASRAAAAIAEEGVTVAEATRRADAAAALLSMTKLEEEIERLRGIGGCTPPRLGNTSIVTAPFPGVPSHALQTMARINRALTSFLTSGLGLALGSVAALSALAAAPYDENCSFLSKLADAGSARPTCGFGGFRIPPT